MTRPRWHRRRHLAAGAILFLVVYLAGYRGPYLPVRSPPSNLVDLHCHLAGLGAQGSGCYVAPALRGSWKFSVYLRSFGVTERELVAQGDGVVADWVSRRLAESRYVKRAVVLALDGVVDGKGEIDMARTQVYVPNEFVAEMARTHTNLLFGASVNPHRKDALARLAWAKSHGAVLIKWIPSIMEIDPADAVLEPFYRELARLELPLLSHTGNEKSFSSARDEYGDPQRLRLPLRLGVRVIAAHIASTGSFEGQRSTDRLVQLMGQYPNLYSEISSLTQVNKLGYLGEALQRKEFAGRLAYATDFPLIDTALVSPWYYPLRLRPWTMWRIWRMSNPWDRDVELKSALGTPPEVFSLSARLVVMEGAAAR